MRNWWLRARLRFLMRRGCSPALIQPIPTLGPNPETLERHLLHEWLGDRFLWAPAMGRRGLCLKGPSDAEYLARYHEVKDGRITYNPVTATARLLALIAHERDEPPVLSVAPVATDRFAARILTT